MGAMCTVLLGGCAKPTAAIAPSDPPPPPLAQPLPPRSPTPASPQPIASITTTAANLCEPDVAPLLRTAGDLTAHAPASPRESPEFRGRLRTHTEGGLTLGSARTWVGPVVPGYVPLMIDTAELFLLERDGETYVALYRDPYGAGSCELSTPANCRFVVRGFQDCEPTYTLELAAFMSRPTHLEIQDLRVMDGVVYFNEACQSYAKDAGGRCSALVAVDARSGTLRWRTRNLVSNNRFLLVGAYIIAGYGFTDERDALHLVRRTDGAVVHRTKLPTAHEDLVIGDDGVLEVALATSGSRRFVLRGFDTRKPTLVPAQAAQAQSD